MQNMICRQCGNDAEQMVTSVVDGTQRCFSCHAGPDIYMLRQVQIEFRNGKIEDRVVWAENNRTAFEAVGWTREVASMMARPLPN
jgi:hypothetical protein